MRLPLRRPPARIALSDETVVVVFVPAVLAPAETRHLAEDFGMPRGE